MRPRRFLPVVAAVAVLAAARAHAWLETGVLLTNAASATYLSVGGQRSVTYSATMRVLVANPALFLWKDATPTYVGSVGGFVTYTLAFSNGGVNTVFNVTINDRLPNVGGLWWTSLLTAWSGAGPPSGSYSYNGFTYFAGMPPAGQGSATGIRMRWIVPSLGIGVSGVITFVVSLG